VNPSSSRPRLSSSFSRKVVPFVGKRSHCGFFSSSFIVAFVKQRDHIIATLYISERSCDGPEIIEWRPCFIDQNTVDLIHDGKVVLLLKNSGLSSDFMLFAEIIKPSSLFVA